MGRFTERIGLTQPRSVIQVNDLDDPTRVALWNVIYRILPALPNSSTQYGADRFLRPAWSEYFESELNTFTEARTTQKMRELILAGEWSGALDFIDWSVGAFDAVSPGNGIGAVAAGAFNEALGRYLVGYRFVDEVLLPVTDDAEMHSIELAVNASSPTARTHLQRALQLLSNLERPQHAKVISEAIAAVEATVFDITGKRILSDGLKALEASGVPIHTALRDAWMKLYGYSSDANGIRHALVREEDATQALAVYFVVQCSAFIGLLRSLKQN